MTDLAIAAEDVGRVYPSDSGDVHALKDVSFAVERGRFVALRGRSGSGKTTLLNCIGGLDKPSSGRIWIQGVDISTLDEAERTRWRRENIGFVFQQMGFAAQFFRLRESRSDGAPGRPAALGAARAHPGKPRAGGPAGLL